MDFPITDVSFTGGCNQRKSFMRDSQRPRGQAPRLSHLGAAPNLQANIILLNLLWLGSPEIHTRTPGASVRVGRSTTARQLPSPAWLLDSRPRDALNTHDIRPQSGHPALSHETIMGKPEGARKQQQTTKWYVHAYLHADRDDVLPLDESDLAGLQFGGKRNYGYGITRLKDTQVVDLEALDYSRLEGAETYLIEMVSPFVLESEYPGADDTDVPWWWEEDRHDLREREEKVLEQREVYRLQTIDHGQVVKYEGDRPVETAKNAIRRVGSHSRYGFGELRVIPIEKTIKN